MNQKPVLEKADSPKEERRCELKYLLTGGRKSFMHSAHTNCSPAMSYSDRQSTVFALKKSSLLP